MHSSMMRVIKIITAMEKETIKNKVFEIIKSRFFHKDTPLTMESKLEDDLWIPDDDPERCLTVKDVVDYIIRRMEE